MQPLRDKRACRRAKNKGWSIESMRGWEERARDPRCQWYEGDKAHISACLHSENCCCILSDCWLRNGHACEDIISAPFKPTMAPVFHPKILMSLARTVCNSPTACDAAVSCPVWDNGRMRNSDTKLSLILTGSSSAEEVHGIFHHSHSTCDCHSVGESDRICTSLWESTCFQTPVFMYKCGMRHWLSSIMPFTACHLALTSHLRYWLSIIGDNMSMQLVSVTEEMWFKLLLYLL